MLKEKYLALKDCHNNRIIIIKQGIFCYCFEDDSIILHNLFNFKYREDYLKSVCFPENALNKVLKRLDLLNITYVISINNKEKMKLGNNDNYNLYLKESLENEEKEKIINSIITKMKDYDKEDLERLFVLTRAVKP